MEPEGMIYPTTAALGVVCLVVLGILLLVT
jgi:hypothetical protein